MPKKPSFKSTFAPKNSSKDSETVGSAKANRAARRKALQDAYAAEHPESVTSVTHSVASLKAALREGAVSGITSDKTAIPTKKASKEIPLNPSSQAGLSEAPIKTKLKKETPSKPAAKTVRAATPSKPAREKPTTGKTASGKSAEKPKHKKDFVDEEFASGPPPETPVEEAKSFETLELPEPIMQAVRDLEFESMTPIQAQAIPVLLQGRDIIGQAQTGTGKTAAFALPIIAKVDVKKNVPQALVLAPTRELAVQVAGGIYALAKHTGLRVVPVYGGQPIDRQFRALKMGAHVVVGTPGRLIDHLRRGSLSLDTVTFCVLDEADEMLALGFMEEVEEILAALPAQRQTAFFSATMPARVKGLSKQFLKSPEHITINAKHRTVDSVEQTYYEVQRGKKPDALARVLDMEAPGPTIVFCRTRQETNDVAEALRVRGYNAESLNGEMSQNDRDRVLRRFRTGQADLLVATDVAARGLDIETVTHVINYAIPFDVEQYIHRIGRTGRAGRTGDAITLVEINERRKLKTIEQVTGVKMKMARIPTAADIAARRRDAFRQDVLEVLQKGEFESELETVEGLNDEFDTSEIAAAALHMLWQSRHNQSSNAADLAADHEQPETGMTRIFVGVGKADGLRPGELVAVIAGKCDMSGREIGTIDILDRSTFVEVPTDKTSQVISMLRKEKLRGRKAAVDIATPKKK
jgi:ATP-dependent RNA helicase DeaD